VFLDDAELRRKQYAQFIEQTRLAGATTPDLVLWPETALPGVYPYSEVSHEFLKLGLEAARAPLLTGLVEEKRVLNTGDRRKDFLHHNSAWLFAPNGEPIAAYRKQHLVPFGEYIPLDKKIPILQRLAPTGMSCTPGDTSGVMTLTRTNGHTLTIGPLICFEDTVPDLSRRAVRDGARMLALVTNDAWFNGSIEPVQHLHQAVFRAVENGVPMVRCANSGVSCVVSPVGKISMLESDGVIMDFHGLKVAPVFVPETPLAAPYTRYGDWLFTIPGVFLVVGLALIHKRPRLPFSRRT
jgi:apolipoprotein N-acyltransferase